MRILLNQTGYIVQAQKKVIVQTFKNEELQSFDIVNEDGDIQFIGDLNRVGTVRNWNQGYFYVGDFSPFCTCGMYKIRSGGVYSDSFEINEGLSDLRLINAATYFFKAQRSTGKWINEDRHLHFAGRREGIKDVHGGWFDASGDHGIHLSHLSHSTYYNPQQAGFATYSLFKSYEYIKEKKYISYDILLERMLDEGDWGADFLMRMRAPSGSFFRSIRRTEDVDNLSKIEGTRCINFEYRGSSDQFGSADTASKEIISDENYETSLRSGGGLAIAALAIAGRHESVSIDYKPTDYIAAAEASWNYLKKENCRYTNDKTWNFIDYYCSLIACTELFKSTGKIEYLEDARNMAAALEKFSEYISNDEAVFQFIKGMPFHHASDEGMPIVALLQYAVLEVNAEKKDRAIKLCECVMRRKLKISTAENNPFAYPLFECLEDGEVCTKFFFPHHTSVSPWWQGENARLASISAASSLLMKYSEDAELKILLNEFRYSAIDWILGQNPYDSCMMEGFGKNNPEYFFYDRFDYLNCPGGIVNGITSKEDDEDSIDLVVKPRDGIKDNWRWAEQWVPHVAWFIFAKSVI